MPIDVSAKLKAEEEKVKIQKKKSEMYPRIEKDVLSFLRRNKGMAYSEMELINELKTGRKDEDALIHYVLQSVFEMQHLEIKKLYDKNGNTVKAYYAR